MAGLHEHSQLLYPWFYIHATHELAPSVNRKHVRLARRVRTGLRNQMSIDLGEGSRSDFSGDGTLADHLCEHVKRQKVQLRPNALISFCARALPC